MANFRRRVGELWNCIGNIPVKLAKRPAACYAISKAPRIEAGSPMQEPPQAFKHLQPGRRYRVAGAFVDYDGVGHSEGESWLFLTYGFLPYEDGLSLFIRTDDGAKGRIRLQWRPESQAEVIDALENHLTEVPS
jgi:hypothetical protein